MKRMISAVAAAATLTLAGTFGASAAFATGATSTTVSLPHGYLYSSAVAPDGSAIAYAPEYDSTVFVLDTAAHTITAVDDPNSWLSDDLGSMVYSPDGATIYVADYTNNRLDVIDATTLTVVDYLEDDFFNGAWLLAISPDGSTLYVGNYSDEYMVVLSTDGTHITALPSSTAASLYAIYPSADGELVYTVTWEGVVNKWGVTGGTYQTGIDFTDLYVALDGDGVAGSCFDAASNVLYLSANSTGVYKVDLADGTVLGNANSGGPNDGWTHHACAVSPDGSTVFFTSQSIGDPDAVPAVPGVVDEVDAATFTWTGNTYPFDGLFNTSLMNFTDSCTAWVAGYYGDLQEFVLDPCTTDPAPSDSPSPTPSATVASLASTGIDSGALATAVAVALLALLGGGAALRRSALRG